MNIWCGRRSLIFLYLFFLQKKKLDDVNIQFTMLALTDFFASLLMLIHYSVRMSYWKKSDLERMLNDRFNSDNASNAILVAGAVCLFDAYTRLYKSVCQLVGPSVRPSVGPSVRQSFRYCSYPKYMTDVVVYTALFCAQYSSTGRSILFTHMYIYVYIRAG